MEQDTTRKRFTGRNILMGLILLGVAGVLFLKQSGYPFPEWLFTWPVIVILFGIFTGVRHRFRNFSWFALILVGSMFLGNEIWPEMHVTQYAIPLAIATVGLIFIFSPRRGGPCGGRFRDRARMRRRFYEERFGYAAPGEQNSGGEPNASTTQDVRAESTDSVLDVVSVFSGIKKNVFSKEFAGGEVVCVFGGLELNLTNADFKSPIVIDAVQIFGGTKLIVPANWEVRSEITALFGGMDDKRRPPITGQPEKTIILTGTVILGGIEVASY